MKRFTPKGERSRQRILNEAIRLFAEKGFTDTFLMEIAEAAGSNKRMVYHYFGNKEKLYQAVLVEEYNKLSALEVEALVSDSEAPIEKVITDIVSVYFSFLQSNPEFVRLILWENLNNGRSLDEMQIPISKSPMLDLLDKAVKKGKKDKTIRTDTDPRLLLINLLGACTIYFSNQYTLSRALKIDLTSQRTLNRAKKEVINLFIGGIIT